MYVITPGTHLSYGLRFSPDIKPLAASGIIMTALPKSLPAIPGEKCLRPKIGIANSFMPSPHPMTQRPDEPDAVSHDDATNLTDNCLTNEMVLQR
jgi:hypothetical protein